mmetsp:Transcript_95624/g.270592  ORF Transcript_95624/g.270592 Transcript_95624/m.270592 type:complete len:560 (+) Transcript_95624:62-1741(+)
MWTIFVSSGICSLVLVPCVALKQKHVGSAATLFHDGHAASYVTRLTRVDSSGLKGFLEVEDAWERRITGTNGTFAELRHRRSGDNLNYMPIPSSQLQALGEHQRRHLHGSWPSLLIEVFGDQGDEGAQTFEEAVRTHSGNESTPANIVVKKHLPKSKDVTQMATSRLRCFGNEYVGPISVGTPRDKDQTPTQLWVVLDTGSTNIWVASDYCMQTNSPCAKPSRGRFDHKQSTSFSWPSKTNLNVRFATGELEGPIGADEIHIGPFVVHNQSFALIRDQSGRIFEDTPLEGILGLGFPSLASRSITPFFDTIIRQSTLPHNEFAFYLSKVDPAENAVFWGGVDPAFYEGEIEFFRVTDPYYWAIDLVSFSIGEKTLLGEGGSHNPAYLATSISMLDRGAGHRDKKKRPLRAIVDTGTNFFTAESYLFGQVMQALPSIKCKDITEQTHPPLKYVLRNVKNELRTHYIPNSVYMLGGEPPQEDGKCTPGFMKVDVPEAHSPAMLFGEVFMKAFFVVFDRVDGREDAARIGFAKARSDDRATARLRDLTRSQPSFRESRQMKT